MSTISVTVVYALPESAIEVDVMLPSGATVADALERSRLAAIQPEIDLACCAVGIFGRRVERDQVLADGDRVEVYRPLAAEPKDARRRRAHGRDR